MQCINYVPYYFGNAHNDNLYGVFFAVICWFCLGQTGGSNNNCLGYADKVQVGKTCQIASVSFGNLRSSFPQGFDYQFSQNKIASEAKTLPLLNLGKNLFSSIAKLWVTLKTVNKDDAIQGNSITSSSSSLAMIPVLYEYKPLHPLQTTDHDAFQKFAPYDLGVLPKTVP